MEHVSSISTGELQERWEKMRKWKKPTYEQMMEYLRIYSELAVRGAV